jgi:gas vesicle structural protein
MSPPTRHPATLESPAHGRDIGLVDLIDRLLDGGVVIHGDITLAVADVDLLYVGLRALVASVETIEQQMGVRLSARSAAVESDALGV